ncbi:Glycosyltransferase PglI [Serinibacter arcticus]|uniref:Glycosyltransferase PglI n=1 Tax=Serinibacter arcticus TaxID=1655435 RepID=A0A4Z1E6C8_9MICO|nr:Glycosyltransferase PglI [Serinibacter arcticus]
MHALNHALTSRGHTTVILTRDEADTRARFGGDVATAPTPVFPWAPAEREAYLASIQNLLAGREHDLTDDDPVHALRATLRTCDALVVAGGGNMNSRYGWLMYERMAALAIARSLDLPTLVTGQTVGPALTRPDVRTLVDGLSGTLAVGAREDATQRLLERLLPDGLVHRVLDDAAFLGDVPVPTGVAPSPSAPESSAGAVVVTIAHGSLGVDDAALPRLVRALDDLAERSGAPIHLVPHMAVPGTRHVDIEIHDRIAAALAAPAVSLDVEHALVAARRAREAAIVVTTRYHPAVFAAEGGVPALAIAADDYSRVRLAGALGSWGLDGAVLPLADVEVVPDLLSRRLLALWEGRDRVAGALAAAAPALAAHASAFWDTASDAVATGRISGDARTSSHLPEVARVVAPGAEVDVTSPSTPVVSVVVRTKDRPTMLARALDDIAGQTFSSLEVVVVNDAGDAAEVDAVVAQVVGLEDRVRVLHRIVSTGMEAASNAGVELARGEMLAIHDDDDTWDPAFLARSVAHLRHHPTDRAVAARTAIVWERSVDGVERLVEEGREIFEPHVRLVTVLDLMRYNRMVPISLLLRRSVLEEIGKFDESLSVVGDWEFNLRLATLGPVTVMPGEPLAFWHQRRAATDELGNSVIVDADAHLDVDLRLRDERLRRHVAERGDGDLMYLTRFMHERHEELAGHVLAVEQRIVDLENRLGRALEAIGHETREAGVVGLARRKYWAARHRLRGGRGKGADLD